MKNTKLLIITVFAFSVLVLMSFTFVRADFADSVDLLQAAPLIPEIKPPFGFVNEPGLTSIKLAWVNQPKSTVKIAGYFVYYWQQLQGFEKIQLASDRIITSQIYTIENLYPATKYCVAVRAATSEYIENAERIGDYFLSRFSEVFCVKTELNIKLEMLSATETTGIFKVSKYDVIKKNWLSSDFFCEVNNIIGGIKTINSQEIDFRTDWVLTEIQAIEQPSKDIENLTFTDVSDPKIKVEIPFPSRKTEENIIFRAKLLNQKTKQLTFIDTKN